VDVSITAAAAQITLDSFPAASLIFPSLANDGHRNCDLTTKLGVILDLYTTLERRSHGTQAIDYTSETKP
jgi:hypothetical protein